MGCGCIRRVRAAESQDAFKNCLPPLQVAYFFSICPRECLCSICYFLYTLFVCPKPLLFPLCSHGPNGELLTQQYKFFFENGSLAMQVHPNPPPHSVISHKIAFYNYNRISVCLCARIDLPNHSILRLPLTHTTFSFSSCLWSTSSRS